MFIHTEYPAPALLLWKLDHGRVLSIFLIFILVPPVTAQLQNEEPPPPPDPFARLRFDKTMAVVLVILVVVFFILGFISIYTRQCTERRIGGRLDLPVHIIGGNERRASRGIDPAIIDTFPTFVYSDVKGLKIGRVTLECAVCLNEFRDDETLRLIPKCSHVFHPDCIDAWLVSHSTCPVCRANLVPKSGETEIQIVSQPEHDPNSIARIDDDDGNRVITEIRNPRVNLLNVSDDNRPVRSRSPRIGITRLFPRSHSTGHSLVRPGADCERFTLRLPEEVQNRLVNSTSTLNRTKSCVAMLQRESSERRGYRTRSVGRNYLQYERFDTEGRADRWGFMWTPPFLGRAGSMRSTNNDHVNKVSVVVDDVDVGERSCDCLFSKD